MQINITRKPKNTRFGSLAWATTLPVDKWVWKISHRSFDPVEGLNGGNRLDIYNGDMLLASFAIVEREWSHHFDEVRTTTEHPDINKSVQYGGAWIGNVLFERLATWADTLDLDVDDHGEMLITSA